VPLGKMTSSYETLMSIVRERRSVRRWRDEELPDALIEQILEAARWAPSAGNRQAYRLLIVRSREKIAAMAGVVRRAAQRIAEGARAELAEEAASYLANFHHFEGAPVVVAPIYRSGFDLRRALGGEEEQGTGDNGGLDALSSVAAAIMSMLLAAQALGVGACWMTGPLIARRELGELLEVPRGWEIAALVPLGRPAEAPPAPPRRALGQLVRWIE
jgi:nitroreductase